MKSASINPENNNLRSESKHTSSTHSGSVNIKSHYWLITDKDNEIQPLFEEQELLPHWHSKMGGGSQITLNDQSTEYVSTFKNAVHNTILNPITDFSMKLSHF